jgi:hypothetical protein
MIFKYAAQKDDEYWGYPRGIRLIFNKLGKISHSGTSVYEPRSTPKNTSVGLPRVCRQIYAETAKLTYSENDFVFITVKASERWLSKRLVAQREAISRLCVLGLSNDSKKALMAKISPMCPNLTVLAAGPYMEEDTEEDMCSCCMQDPFRGRRAQPWRLGRREGPYGARRGVW